jgi:hypothetical protein
MMAGDDTGVGGNLEADSGDVVERDVELLEQASEGKAGDDKGLVIPKINKEVSGEESEELDEGKGEESEGEEPEEEPEETPEELPEDELEVATRPTFNSIARKFPEFFKTFPEFKDMMAREAEYAKRFPTVESADEAFEKASEFDSISDSLADGNMRGILDTVASVSESALSSVAEKFLPELMQRDQSLYLRAITPSLAIVVNQLYKHGISKGDRNIQNAALIASEWIFDSEDYATGAKRVPNPLEAERDPERLKLQKEKDTFLNTKLSTLRDSVVSVAETKLYAKIDEGLKNLSGLNEFTRKTIRQSIYDEVGQRLQGDKAHMKLMDSIWGRARREGYGDPQWKTRLVTAYLARALHLVPSVRAKVVGQALEHRKASVKQGMQQSKPIKVTSQQSGQPRAQAVTNRLPTDPKMIDRRKTTDLDILNGKITLKGNRSN